MNGELILKAVGCIIGGAVFVVIVSWIIQIRAELRKERK